MPLFHIHCPDPALANLLTDLTAQLEVKGAWFHPDMVIDADAQGNIAIQSASRQSDRRSFVRIPLALMPFEDDFDFSVNRDDLVSTPVSRDIDPLHVQVMEQMIAIYNACGKLSQWKQTSPLFSLAPWPDIQTLMFQAKAHAPKLQKYLAMKTSADKNPLLVNSFLGSRVFNLQPGFLKEIGHENASEGKAVIMPVIDYFNHRFQAEGFSIQTTPDPPCMRVFGIPDAATGEVFVRYNLYDPVDTFLFYGFVDTHAPWVASIPLGLDLPDGRRLFVLNTGGAVKKQVPQAVKDLRLYLPMIQDPSAQEVKINKLLIPGQGAPRALQRVLAGVVQNLCKGMSQPDIMAWVKKQEAVVIETNRQWWHRLSDMAEILPDVPVAVQVRELCRCGSGHLVRYGKIHGI